MRLICSSYCGVVWVLLLLLQPTLAFIVRPTSNSNFYTQCTTSLPRLQATASREGSIQVSRPDGSEHQLVFRIIRSMNVSSQQAAPIVALHGGPSVPSNYLYPLEQVVPYRSIVFYDQLGCGQSDEPKDVTLYGIDKSVDDLKVLLKKLGIKRFHLYGQSYGGILAFEYLKSLAMDKDNSNEIECLSCILSSVPSNVKEIEQEFVRLMEELKIKNPDADDTELNDLFRMNHQCRMPEMPDKLKEAYANAGTVWRGTDAIAGYAAESPQEDTKRMPSTLLLRGEFDFVSDKAVQRWKNILNTPFVRSKTLEDCSHHALFENEKMYGEIVDSFFGEYD